MKKAFLAALLAAVLTAGTEVSASAADTVYAEEVTNNKFNTLDEYLEFSIPRHLYAQKLALDEEIEYSRPIALYNFEANEIVGTEIFLIDNGKLIGKMEIYSKDGEYVSCFDTTITNEIINAYVNGDQVAIGSFENSLMLYSDSSGFSFVDGLKSNGEPINIPTELSFIGAVDSINLNYIMPYSIADLELSVSHVHNSCTYNSVGQCWASCAAMKINYELGRSLTSDNVYEDLRKAEIDFSVNGTQKALTYYGYPNFVRTGGAMRPGDVATQLVNDHPVIMHISNASGTSTHAVIIYGIVMETSNTVYRIDDPNYKTAKTILHNTNMGVINSTISQYTSLTYHFTKWYNAFY